MRGARFDHWPCPVARTTDLLGDPWVPMILRECTYGVSRFDDFQRRLSIGRNILNTRLQRMCEQGLLERERYSERPARHRYLLTAKGRDLTLLLAAMVRFASDWIFEPGQEPVVLKDRDTGRRIRPRLVDERTGRPLDPARVVPAAGPGFPGDAALRKQWFQPETGPTETSDPA